MKDFLGQDVNPGDCFVYALTVGRSACMGLYEFREESVDGVVKAVKLDASYGMSNKYSVYDGKLRAFRDMTEEERFKIDNKLSRLTLFKERACKIYHKDFK